MLEIRDLDVSFKRHQVLRGVNLTVASGQTVGLVGESGSGKSTVARAVVGVVRPSRGTIRCSGKVQLIPQDPYSSLNPRMTVGQAIAEAIEPRRIRLKEHMDEIVLRLSQVALDPDTVGRYPHEFSGGQRQRIAIARALAAKPDLIIADEITSALDTTIQAEVLGLLRQLRHQLGLTMLFISHDLAVVRHVSDEVAVLLHGEIVERGTHIFDSPQHEYTRKLLASAPTYPVDHELRGQVRRRVTCLTY